MEAELRRLKTYMDKVGFPAEPHPESSAIVERIAVQIGAPLSPVLVEFFKRSLHAREINTDNERAGTAFSIYTFAPDLIDDYCWGEGALDDPDLRGMICFAADAGASLFALALDDRWRLGKDVVYAVSRGAPMLEATDMIASSVVELLAIHADGAASLERPVVDLRDEQTAGLSLPLVTADGRTLSPDDVFDPRYHPGLDALRSVRLQRALTLDGVPYEPDPDYRGSMTHPDLSFARDGSVKAGYLAAETVVQGVPLAGGSAVGFQGSGELEYFTLARATLFNGVRCLGGSKVLRNRCFHFVPADDVTYAGLPCKAGTNVSDDGEPYRGLHFTASRAFDFAGRPVPADSKVTLTYDGELRFTVARPFELEGRLLPAETHVWYDRAGRIKDIYPRPA